MIKLTTGPGIINNLGLDSKDLLSSMTALVAMLIDLYTGIPVSFRDSFSLYDYEPCDGEEHQINILYNNGYYQYNTAEGLYEFLVVEIPALVGRSNPALSDLGKYLQTHVPTSYDKPLAGTITDKALCGLFYNKGLLIFSFLNDNLVQISTSAYNSKLETYINYHLIERENAYSESILQGISQMYNTEIITTGTCSSSSYYSYSKPYNTGSRLLLNVKKDYFRVNTIEVNKGEFSLLLDNEHVSGLYSRNKGFSNLITYLIAPELFENNVVNKVVMERTLFNLDYGISHQGSLDICPIVMSNDTAHTKITLSDKDANFLAAIKTITKDTIYTKHKKFTVHPEDYKITRGCNALTNASGHIKVFVRDDKKKASDEEAYKNRIFRDYLSHAISLVVIPIFQKEFVIPDCLSNSFSFNMATLNSAAFMPHAYSKVRRTEQYKGVFENKANDPNWVMPVVPSISVNSGRVEQFVKDFKEQTLVSATQSNSSIFTRQFVEPFIETHNAYSVPTKPMPFGWMFDIDSNLTKSWDYTLLSAHLLRISQSRGRFYCDCGLMTDKTFGIKAILKHVFIKQAFSGHALYEYSALTPEQVLTPDKKGAYISAMLDIYTANFVPNDEVESAIKTYGSVDYPTYLARVNQLLFLQEESLTILQSLYQCKNFEDLATALDFCMPVCLEMVNNLNYSEPLKQHVSIMLKYFWETTTAISEELNPNDTTE